MKKASAPRAARRRSGKSTARRPAMPLASVLAALLGAPMLAPGQTYFNIPTDADATITTPGIQSGGRSVTVLGDVNGDDLDDFLVRDSSSSSYCGTQAVRVFFGGLSGPYAHLQSSTEGFDIVSGSSRRILDACAAGDVNGDGLEDVLVSLSGLSSSSCCCCCSIVSPPMAAVVFGKGNHDQVDLANLGGAAPKGFLVTGFQQYDNSLSISEAGDFNGDGLDDIVCGNTHSVGATGFPITLIGAAFVVFGKSADADDVDVFTATPGQCLRVEFPQSGYPWYYGYDNCRVLAGGGDVNGDGFDDLVLALGHYFDSTLRVVFGGAPIKPPPSRAVDAKGFAIEGALGAGRDSDSPVAILGDFDGDGLDDIVEAGYNFCYCSARANIVFGKNDADPVDLADRKAGRGAPGSPISFAPIFGVRGFDPLVSRVGDVDNDGLDDVLVSRETSTYTACTCLSQTAVALFRGDSSRAPLEFDAPPAPTKSWVGRGPDYLVLPETAVAGELVTMHGSNGVALFSCDGIFKSAGKKKAAKAPPASSNIVSLVEFAAEVACPGDVIEPEQECGGELAVFTPSVTTATDLYFGVTFTEEVSGVDAGDFSGTAAPYIVDIDPSGTGLSFTIQVQVPGPGTYTLAWNGGATIEDCGGNGFDPTGDSATVEVVAAGPAPSPNLQFAQGTGANSDRFGAAVAISGAVALVGAPAADPSGITSAGAVHVAEQDGAGSHPIVQRLVASDAAASDAFGSAVSISGDLAIVGSPYDDASTALPNSGSAYLFGRDGDTGLWNQVAKLVATQQGATWLAGFSVATDGQTALVGVPNGEPVPGGISKLRGGRVVVFERDSCTGTWSETAVLSAPDASSYDAFGSSVAVSNGIALVGSPGDDDFGASSGAAYVFRRTGPGVWTFETKIWAADTVGGDNFGTSVSLRGTLAAIGAPGNDQKASNAGAVYAFERLGPGIWVQKPKALAIDGAVADQLGTSVSTDGTTVVGGAPGHDANGSNAGAMYKFNPATGAQTGKFLTAATNASDTLGTSVAVDGARAVAGSPLGSVSPTGLVPTIAGTPGVVFFHQP